MLHFHLLITTRFLLLELHKTIKTTIPYCSELLIQLGFPDNNHILVYAFGFSASFAHTGLDEQLTYVFTSDTSAD